MVRLLAVAPLICGSALKHIGTLNSNSGMHDDFEQKPQRTQQYITVVKSKLRL